MRKPKIGGRLAIVTVAVTFALGLHAQGLYGSERSNQEEPKTTNSKLVADPFAYATAEQMYRVATARPFDQNAGRLIAQVRNALSSGKIPEDEEVWSALMKLNPYRKTDQVQAAFTDWITKASGAIRKRLRLSAATAAAEFSEANRLYRAGKFTEASSIYRSILRRLPGRLDARNNLALSQMHLDNDLLALLELEVNRKLDANYCAGGINATVVAERLGQRKYAAKLADETAALRPDIAQASFNAQWFDMFEKSHPSSVSGFPMNIKTESEIAAPPGTKQKFSQLFDIAQEYRKKGFWNIGLRGRFSGNKWWPPAIRWGVFFGLAVLLFVMYATLRRKYSFWLFLLIAGFWYVLFWGTMRSYDGLFLAYMVIIFFLAFIGRRREKVTT